jgi:light-regulated signal transduction histidine kinase (bacteriophytochrome)
MRNTELEQIKALECAKEPIHIPGTIQPHGALLVVNQATGKVEQSSENAGLMLNLSGEINGRDLKDIFPEFDLSQSFVEAGKYSVIYVTLRGPHSRPFSGSVFLVDKVVVFEIENPLNNYIGFKHAELLNREMTFLNEAPSIAELLAVTAEIVRRLAGYDRAMIYRFDHDWHGEVVAESRNAELGSYMGLHFPSSDIPPQARELFTKNWIRMIPERDYQPIPIVPALNPSTAQPIDLTKSGLRSVSPIHLEYLRNMEVSASLTISILRNGQLWGLIACHNKLPGYVSPALRSSCELIGRLLSVRLSAKQDVDRQLLYDKLRLTMAGVTDRVKASKNRDLAAFELISEIKGLTQADGIAVLSPESFSTDGVVPTREEIDELSRWLRSQGPVFQSAHLSSIYPPAKAFSKVGSGLLSIQIENDLILWFRGEVVNTVKWAGAPDQPSTRQNDATLHPRKSFEAWAEVMNGVAIPWLPQEVEAASALREMLFNFKNAKTSFSSINGLATKSFSSNLVDEMKRQIRETLKATASPNTPLNTRGQTEEDALMAKIENELKRATSVDRLED